MDIGAALIYMQEKLAIKLFQSMENHTIQLCLCQKTTRKKSYIVQWTTFTLPFNLQPESIRQERTGACGTARPRKGLPIEIVKAKFKQRGDYNCMTYNDEIVSMSILNILLYIVVKKLTQGENIGKQKKL